MSIELWLAYVAACTLLLVVPGPTILLVLSYAVSEGRRSAWRTVPAVALGDFTAMACSLAGLGAVMAASGLLFAVLKWAGAAYLVYLGVRMWRAPAAVADTASAAGRPRAAGAMAWRVYAVTASNPKSIMFFVAFLPQFVAPEAAMLSQFVLLGGTFLVLATINAALYAVLAGAARDWMWRPAVLRIFNRLGGGILVAAGAMTATLRRTA